MPQLVLLPGLDGTALLFRPLVATLLDVDTKVVSYPNGKALSLDEHARLRRSALLASGEIARVRATHF